MRIEILALFLFFSFSFTAGKRIVYPNQNEIPIFSQTQRIIGGSTAEDGLAPYQVSLQGEFGHYCGGAILNTDWIITAAHCVFNKKPSEITIMTGSQDLRTPGGKYRVEKIYTHCNYDTPKMHNDIALLNLKSSIVFNKRTQPVPLPMEPLKDGDDVLLTGWGSEVVLGDAPDRLKKINLKYMNYTRCKEALHGHSGVALSHICTFTRYGEGACHGDSGGPLVNNGNLVGLVNWGLPCAIGYPDLHASTYYYMNWINDTLNGKKNC